MAIKTFNVTKQYMADTITGSANPGDLHIPIGRWDPGTGLGWQTRALLYAPVSFSGMTAINSARIYLRANAPSSGWHAKGTTSTVLNARRKTADWNETSGGVSSSVDETWGGNGGSYVSSNFAENVGDDGTIPNMTDGSWYYIDITEAVKAWKSGSPNYGIMLYNYTSASDHQYAKQFWSRHASGSIPYIWIDYSTNTAPYHPTNMSPTGWQIVNTGSTITYSGARHDPDAGDYITAYNIQLYLDDGVTKIGDWTYTTTGTPTTFSHAISLPSGRPTNTYYQWAARTRDKGNAWGPFTPKHRFKPNSLPWTPASTHGQDTDTLTPSFWGGFSDSDPGDYMTAARIQVQNSTGTVTYYDSNDQSKSGSTWTITMTNALPSWGTSYRWRAQVRDSNNAYSGWTSYKTFTVTQPAGPTLTPRTTATKQNTRTPTLGVSYSTQFKNHELFIYSNSAGTTQVWSNTSGTDYALVTSRNMTSTTLNWGTQYWWKARVKLDDNTWTAFSALAPFYINALPSAPTGLAARNAAGESVTTINSIDVVTTTTPRLEATFNDADIASYGDAPNSRVIEIYNNSTNALVHSNTLASPPHTSPMAYAVPSGVISNDIVYKMRWQFTDNAGQASPWSSYKLFKATTASTVTGVAPTGTVTASTFTVTWTFTASGGKAQRSKQIDIYNTDDDSLVYGSGVILSSTKSHVIPAGYLKNNTTYRISVTALDTDGV